MSHGGPVLVRRVLSCVAVAVTAMSLSVVGRADAQPAVAQSQVVSAVPASYTPNIDGGVVYSIAQVGTTIVAGGTFTKATAHGSTTAVVAKGLVAFDQGTGAINTAFAPVLNGAVDFVLAGPTAGTVYVGGAFATVNGAKSKAIVLLNVSNGSVVTGWKPAILNGAVYSARVSGGLLFVTGIFSTAGGIAHSGIATLNPTTGALNPYLNVQLTGHHNYNGTSGASGGVGGRAMDISPDGTRAIVVGDFKNADGVVHDQVVMLDLGATSATVDAWNTARFTAPCASWAFDSYLEDVDFSQDGSYFAIAATGGSTFSTNTDGSRSLCDSATRWATTDTGTNVQPTWVDYTGNDSFWSVAVTGTAVYLGGHPRWVNNPNGSDSAGAGAVARPGIVALDPTNGLPLAWNPGRNPRGAGAYALLATAQGLWVGSDTNYIGNYKYKHDEIAFFPLTGGYTPAATTTQSLPANVYSAGALPNSTNTNVLYRVDAGGPTIAATDGGPDWTADASDTDAGAAYRNKQSNPAGYSQIAAVNPVVPASTPSAIFSSERWSTTDNPPMTWDFPVAAGTTVEVRLYFANRYAGTSAIGQRVFNVNLNGSQVLANYDIVADTGDQTGTMKAFDITVPASGTYTGDVDINLTHVVENPLINGIEIVRTGTSAGTTGTTSDLAYRADTGATTTGTGIGVLTTVANTGIDWSTTRGAFMVGSTIFYGSTNGSFYKAGFNGTTVGVAVAVDPYDDPTWDAVPTGSGPTYQGAKSGFYAEIPDVTGAFYSDGRMYYTLTGQSTLYWRYFTPDSGTIGGTEFTAAGGDFSNVAGEFLSGSTLYYANRTDGTLHTVAFTNGGTNGANPSVDATTDATVSGPAIDGTDWRARSLFAYGTPMATGGN